MNLYYENSLVMIEDDDDDNNDDDNDDSEILKAVEVLFVVACQAMIDSVV